MNSLLKRPCKNAAYDSLSSPQVMNRFEVPFYSGIGTPHSYKASSSHDLATEILSITTEIF